MMNRFLRRVDSAILFALNALGIAALVFSLLVLSSPAIFAQAGTGTLKGQVADPSGAVIPQAQVTVTEANGKTAATATADATGAYVIQGLAPGNYTVTATSPGFAPFTAPVSITAGSKSLDIAMQIQVEQQQVEVGAGSEPTLSVSAENNASSMVISGKSLDALSDDPDELQDELQALAGPSSGPNGGQIYIDGFTGGELPPKSSIREIRVNQDPFSSEYDRLGYGRIEIFTKPGTDKFHGQAFVQGNDSSFNSSNPFVQSIPPYHTLQYNGSINGPIRPGASFSVNSQYRDIDNLSIINAETLDSNFNPAPFTEALPSPQKRFNFTPRVDLQLGSNNTLTVRYQLWHNVSNNRGVGGLALPERGYDDTWTDHSLQLSDTQIYGPRVVNETRFRYRRSRSKETPQSTATAVSVAGAFSTGGSPSGSSRDAEDSYEFQNYTSIAMPHHFVRFGVRVRDVRDSNYSSSGFNGTYTFGGRTVNGQVLSALQTYQITASGLAKGESFSDILAAGGGASQLTATVGSPTAILNMWDIGIYAGDDWKVKPNFTLSYGVRWESQSGIHDRNDWAPRLSFAYGLGSGKGNPKTVIRAGFGLFYDRFSSDELLQAERQNGIIQTGYVLPNPTFYPNIPSNIGSLPGAQSTIYEVSPSLYAPMTRTVAVGVERQLSRAATVSVTYLNSYGTHQLATRNANAPLPGNQLTRPNAPRPNGKNENIYQYFSEGIFKQSQLIGTVTLRAGNNLTLSGYYQLGYANSDTDGSGSTPSDSYNMLADYGRASFDTRNRVTLIGSYNTPRWDIRLSPYVIAQSGRPYDITLGDDLNGDSFFNDRPTFASNSTLPTVVSTKYGYLNTVPLPGEKVVPVNYGDGPLQFTFNMRASKTLGFGPRTEGPAPTGGGGFGGGGYHGRRGGLGPGGLNGGGGSAGPRSSSNTSHRYNLVLNAQVLNLFDYRNYGQPIGTVGSSFFGQSNGLSGGVFSSNTASRRIYLQAVFVF